MRRHGLHCQGCGFLVGRTIAGGVARLCQEESRDDWVAHDHLAFGIGEHFCLGANLARPELNEIFRGIVTRIDDIELAAAPRRLRSTFINGVKEMRIRFRPGAVEA